MPLTAYAKHIIPTAVPKKYAKGGSFLSSLICILKRLAASDNGMNIKANSVDLATLSASFILLLASAIDISALRVLYVYSMFADTLSSSG